MWNLLYKEQTSAEKNKKSAEKYITYYESADNFIKVQMHKSKWKNLKKHKDTKNIVLKRKKSTQKWHI